MVSIARTHGVSRHDGFRMVEMEEDISPFSFFRFLYINREGLTEADNTLDLVLSRMDTKIELPVISHFRILDRHMTRKLSIGYEEDGSMKVQFQWKSLDVEDLASAIEELGAIPICGKLNLKYSA